MSLTELSYYLRKSAPFAVLALLFILIFFYIFKILLFLGANADKGPVRPYVKLFQGEKIQAPIIKEASSGAGYTYTLDTIEGRPVTATNSARIFQIPPAQTTFGYKQKILLMAKTFGFDTDNTRYAIQDKTATFEEPNQKLAVDISTYNFQYHYDLQKDPTLFTNVRIPSEELIISDATAFLKSVDRFPEEFGRSKPSVIYYTYNPETTELNINETQQDSSNMVEVDFFRPDIEAAPTSISTVTSKFPNSQNYVAMVYNEFTSKTVKAQVKYFETSTTDDKIGVYELKSGDVAWKQLQDGNAYIVNGIPDKKDIIIKNMFLAYYDPDEYQQYFQPVYVFIGSNNFVGYVPAVLDSYLSH